MANQVGEDNKIISNAWSAIGHASCHSSAEAECAFSFVCTLYEQITPELNFYSG